MSIAMKKACHGCPFDVGMPATEMAYNLGCLPSIAEVTRDCQTAGKAWACHSAPRTVCAGYAEAFPERVGLPLLTIEGVHAPKRPIQSRHPTPAG